jgi:hypothetical protein
VEKGHCPWFCIFLPLCHQTLKRCHPLLRFHDPRAGAFATLDAELLNIGVRKSQKIDGVFHHKIFGIHYIEKFNSESFVNWYEKKTTL